ncbi:MAG: NAD-dependent deacylase [Gemmatimonadota bacterium]|nr:NAD-dependent deacylase [Gemmatimonadota bacterium]
MSTSLVDDARAMLAKARSIAVLTGAGISAESGVPTFRGAGGLWKDFRAKELATPQAFARDPRLVWEWYGWRRETIAGCAPNAAHRALAAAAVARDDISIITQNVDGLHAAAAAVHERAMPIELHGSIYRVRCTRCEHRAEDRGMVDATSRESLPACPSCGALMRPDIVWFGESLDPDVLDRGESAAMDADVCLVVGTSGVVHPAAGLAAMTKRAGGRVIEVNPDVTPITAIADVTIRGGAASIIPGILGAS